MSNCERPQPSTPTPDRLGQRKRDLFRGSRIKGGWGDSRFQPPFWAKLYYQQFSAYCNLLAGTIEGMEHQIFLHNAIFGPWRPFLSSNLRKTALPAGGLPSQKTAKDAKSAKE